MCVCLPGSRSVCKTCLCHVKTYMYVITGDTAIKKKTLINGQLIQGLIWKARLYPSSTVTCS